MSMDQRENSSVAMKCRIDADGYWQLVPDRLSKILGYTADEIKQQTFIDITHPEERDKSRSVIQKFKKGTLREFELEQRFRQKSGDSVTLYLSGAPIKNGSGDPEYIACFVHNFSDIKKTQKRLKESEDRWKRLVMKNPQPIQITQDARIIFINQSGVELYGAESEEELIGKSVYEFSDSERVDIIKQRKNRLENNQPVEEVFEHKINCLDGRERHVEIYSIPTTYKNKSTIQSVIYDVTERKKKEEQIVKSLDEKKMLLKEIHHRVKNNLAVISGLLELQAMSTEEKSTKNTLRDSQFRIKSIAMIHEKLYQSKKFSDIGFDQYLKELVETILEAYSSKEKEVTIDYDLDAFTLDLKQAIPCSLIVNEVMVNCFKHAFDSMKKGEISIKTKYEKPEIAITIKDNGSGLPEDFDINQQQSLGMTLIQTLAQQLKGDIRFYQADPRGTVFELNFLKS